MCGSSEVLGEERRGSRRKQRLGRGELSLVSTSVMECVLSLMIISFSAGFVLRGLTFAIIDLCNIIFTLMSSSHYINLHFHWCD